MMSNELSQKTARAEILDLFRQTVSEMTGNRPEDIREDSLIYGELNLTEYDLQLIIKQIGKQIEIDAQSIEDMIAENDNITTVTAVLDLLLDEKELG